MIHCEILIPWPFEPHPFEPPLYLDKISHRITLVIGEGSLKKQFQRKKKKTLSVQSSLRDSVEEHSKP